MSKFYDNIKFDNDEELEYASGFVNKGLIRSACQHFKNDLMGTRAYNFDLLISFDRDECIQNDCDAYLTKDADGYNLKINPELYYEDFYRALAHEFVHIKQDLRGEHYFDIYRGVVNRFPDFDILEGYEVEAYEKEDSLVQSWMEDITHFEVKKKMLENI